MGTDALLVGLLLFAPGSTAHSRRYQPAGRCGERLRLLLVPLSRELHRPAMEFLNWVLTYVIAATPEKPQT